MKSAHIIKPYYDEEGFDTVTFDVDHNLYGVFDGMGTSYGARESAKLCKQVFETRPNNVMMNNFEGLSGMINNCVTLVAEKYPHDGCTATVLYMDDSKRIYYAHTGDSRLYILNDNRIKQITADEGFGNVLNNYVGRYGKGVCQAGMIFEWQALMLCTDGITGDWAEQLLSDTEIENVLLKDKDPERACSELVAMSKKNDDKSVIVIYNNV